MWNWFVRYPSTIPLPEGVISEREQRLNNRMIGVCMALEIPMLTLPPSLPGSDRNRSYFQLAVLKFRIVLSLVQSRRFWYRYTVSSSYSPFVWQFILHALMAYNKFKPLMNQVTKTEFELITRQLVDIIPVDERNWFMFEIVFNTATNGNKSYYEPNLSFLKHLQETGANIQAVDEEGCTLLHFAAHHRPNNVEMIRMLFERGVPIDILNKRQRTYMDYCPIEFRDNLHPVKYLSLKCFAKRTILVNRVPYSHLHLPNRLIEYLAN